MFGIFIYELLVGLPPFFNNDRNILFHNIRTGFLRYPSWEISDEAKDLIEKVHLNFKKFKKLKTLFSFYQEILFKD